MGPLGDQRSHDPIPEGALAPPPCFHADRLKRAALLVLATGLLAVASGQASGHIAPPIATPPDSAFHPVTEDFPPTRAPVALVDDFTAPSPGPRPRVKVPRAKPVVIPVPPPKPRPAPRAVGYPSVADAKAYALRVLGSTEYAALNQIAIHESNWNPHDDNPTSGAYGIPQALPGSKMSTAGADWHDNPVTQVRWMIVYIDARYGSARAAWSYWQSHHWY